MKIDSGLGGNIRNTRATSAKLEADGYDGLWAGETNHDPFLQLVQAAEVTERISIGTSIAIALARTPMTTASTAYDLAAYSEGRFILGLGSQIRPHIVLRFSMPWSDPAARMREYVLAMRAIWATWQDGTKLDFRGDYYTHTLMTPFFTPEAHEWGPPPVYLAGVGALMVEGVGEVCDGFFAHAFTTQRYLRDQTLPALLRGRKKAGHESLEGFTVCGSAFIAVGRTDEELATAIKKTKDQIAFYASTPAYKPVLEAHGWEDLQPELNRLSKQGRWSDMGDAIDDEVLETFAVVGDPTSVGRGVAERWSGAVDRLSLYSAYPCADDIRTEVIESLRGAL